MQGFWREIFGNDHPAEVEIGPGTGTFILAAAQQFTHVNYFGIEHSRSRAFYLNKAVTSRGLSNARVISADAACIVQTFIPPGSVAAYHIYFPDPWWKRQHHRRRLFTAEFVTALARTLTPGAPLHVATDVDDVFDLIERTVRTAGSFVRDHGARSPRFELTVFERKGLARGAVIHEATFVRNGNRPDHTNIAAPMTPAESPSSLRRSDVRSSSLNT
jgi:tRNA (guanine-N7-)-methyltransferase